MWKLGRRAKERSNSRCSTVSRMGPASKKGKQWPLGTQDIAGEWDGRPASLPKAHLCLPLYGLKKEKRQEGTHTGLRSQEPRPPAFSIQIYSLTREFVPFLCGLSAPPKPGSDYVR